MLSSMFLHCLQENPKKETHEWLKHGTLVNILDNSVYKIPWYLVNLLDNMASQEYMMLIPDISILYNFKVSFTNFLLS